MDLMYFRVTYAGWGWAKKKQFFKLSYLPTRPTIVGPCPSLGLYGNFPLDAFKHVTL